MLNEATRLPGPVPTVLKVGLDIALLKKGGDYVRRDSPAQYLTQSGTQRYRRQPPRYQRFASNNRWGSQGLVQDFTYPEIAESKFWTHLRPQHAIPAYYEYGLYYRPSATDPNNFRTVTITNLPWTIQLQTLLSGVRGGEIVSATILNTEEFVVNISTSTTSKTGRLTLNHSALIVFLSGKSAAEYVKFRKEHPMCFGANKAIVKLLPTPTWPLSKAAITGIENGQTRCVVIFKPKDPNVPRIPFYFVVDVLKCANGYRKEAIESTWGNQEGIHIRFGSIQAAGSAYEALIYACPETRIKFEADPCGRPLSDLLLPAGPKGKSCDEVWDHGDAPAVRNNHILPADDTDFESVKVNRDETSFSDGNNKLLEAKEDFIPTPAAGNPHVKVEGNSTSITVPAINSTISNGVKLSWAEEVEEAISEGYAGLTITQPHTTSQFLDKSMTTKQLKIRKVVKPGSTLQSSETPKPIHKPTLIEPLKMREDHRSGSNLQPPESPTSIDKPIPTRPLKMRKVVKSSIVPQPCETSKSLGKPIPTEPLKMRKHVNSGRKNQFSRYTTRLT